MPLAVLLDSIHKDSQHCHTFNLHISIQRKRLDRNTSIGFQRVSQSIGKYDLRSSRIEFTKVGVVDLILLCKIGHIAQEKVNLNTLVDARTGGFQDGCKILDTLMLKIVSEDMSWA